ncbi:MAG: adenylate/guanylate cyclase domain-containing protein [Gammaproteobacteria bacterium]
MSDQESFDMREMRLFIEEVCFNLFRFEQVEEQDLPPQDVHIQQEIFLGVPGLHADMRISVPNRKPFFVEVKFGIPPGRLVSDLLRKFGQSLPQIDDADRLIVITDWKKADQYKTVLEELRGGLAANLELEIWDRNELAKRVARHFDVEIDFGCDDTLVLREAMDDIKGRYAFGDDWRNDLLQSSLLWHYGYWLLKDLYERHDRDARKIFPPSLYPNVVALLADLTSFSSYVRDTRDTRVLRQSLTSFYSKARNEIINAGGMMYQFVGDEVVGLFGLPERSPEYIDKAFDTAHALIDIGNAVSWDWQRQIDRIQKASGVHIGMAMGDMQFVSLRPFGAARLGAVSDSINMGARMLGQASADEVVVSNTFYQNLEESRQQGFECLEPVEAKNMGKIRAWKLSLAARSW